MTWPSGGWVHGQPSHILSKPQLPLLLFNLPFVILLCVNRSIVCLFVYLVYLFILCLLFVLVCIGFHDLLRVSLQGVDEGPDGLKLISEVIQEKLSITMSVLMGANIANEVADEKFCETTIGEGPLQKERDVLSLNRSPNAHRILTAVDGSVDKRLSYDLCIMAWLLSFCRAGQK